MLPQERVLLRHPDSGSNYPRCTHTSQSEWVKHIAVYTSLESSSLCILDLLESTYERVNSLPPPPPPPQKKPIYFSTCEMLMHNS